ncbi:MAG: pilus assembly protein CpaB [Actinomycetota bacterium]|jgi:pilus assembly protein CpaB|nr:pilus assembly protein CpaB [Actinomycetota bacterium]
MIKRQKLMGIVASVVLAGVGTILLMTYVRGAEHKATQGETRVGVLVATEGIPLGTRAEEIGGRVKTESVPAKVAAQGAIADLGLVAGQVTSVDLIPGEQLVQGRFATAAEVGKVTVPPGSLEVTVLLNVVQAAGGKVRVGDSVGVLVSFEDPTTTHLFLQKVPVTGVRTEGGEPVTSEPEAAGPVGNLLVTLALDGPSVERVVFGAEHGHLWLAEQPTNSDEGGTKLQTRAEMDL